MKNIVILGTSHPIQKDDIHGDCLRVLIKSLIKTHGIKAIAEEIDDTCQSIAQGICQELGLGYINIEPTSQEKKVLGIDEPGRIGMEIVMRDVPPGIVSNFFTTEQKVELHSRTQETYLVREAEWFKRIKEFDIWPVLVICGAVHYEPFADLMSNSDLQLEKAGMYILSSQGLHP